MTDPIGITIAGRAVAFWPGNPVVLVVDWDPVDPVGGHTFTFDVIRGDLGLPVAVWPATVGIVGQRITATWAGPATATWGPDLVWRMLRDGQVVLAGPVKRSSPVTDDADPLDPSMTVALAGTGLTVTVSVVGPAWLVTDGSFAGPADLYWLAQRPNDCISWSLWDPYTPLANGVVLTSGKIYACKVPVWKGMTISSVSWLSSSQTAIGMTSQIFGVHDPNGVLLRQTVDDGATPWIVSTTKSLALTAPLTFAYNGYALASIKVDANTATPSLSTKTFSPTLAGMAPVACGNAQTVAGGTMPNLTMPLTAVGSLAIAKFGR